MVQAFCVEQTFQKIILKSNPVQQIRKKANLVYGTNCSFFRIITLQEYVLIASYILKIQINGLT